MLFSFCLRLYNVGAASYWIDEMTSVYFAKAPQLTSIFVDNCPFLYHLLLKIWVTIFGDSEIATRVLSVIFSTTTTFVLMVFGEASFGLLGAAVFGLLHAIFPLSILYAQETRMYALFELGAAVNLLYFYRYWSQGRDERKYLASVLFLALTHYLALIPLFIEGVFFAYSREHRARLKAALVVVGVVAGVLLFSYFQYFSWVHLEWQRLQFGQEHQAESNVLVDLLYGNPISGAAVFVILAAGFIYGWKRSFRREILLFGTLIMSSVALMFIGGQVGHRLVFFPRYFIFLVPIVVTLVGWVLIEVGRSGGRVGQVTSGLLGLVLIAGAVSVLPTVYRPTKAPWNKLAVEVARYPNAVVFTSRTLAIETPYFERQKISVQKLRPTETGLTDMIEVAKRCRPVWIVDTYWGGLGYLPQLEKSLNERHVEVKEYSFKTEYSDPLVALRIIYPCT